ncbi:matrixin family metalloprotease [Mycobacteroides franklinii]|nr:matrixin family metalloprotease [Mycobacteroides franklinii]
MMAIARADCPPDCGGGPGNGGMPSGPPGGGTEFVPPSMPATPSYDPGRGQPPLDQNNGISIYNSAAPQPSQAAQPSQSPVQNQDGSYNRAANGEQQPINYKQAPDNQAINQDWKNFSDQLNQQQQNRPGQEPGDQDRAQTSPERSNDDDERQCAQSMAEAENGEAITNAQQFVSKWPPIKKEGNITVQIKPITKSVEQESGLNASELTNVVNDAMKNWNKKSKAQFVPYADSSQKPDLVISFENLGVVNLGLNSLNLGLNNNSIVSPDDPDAANHVGEKIARAWYIAKNLSDRAANADEELGHAEELNTIRVNASRLPEINDDYERMVQMMMHEMGHGLGLEHSCAQTIMDDSGNPLIGGTIIAPLDATMLSFIQTGKFLTR